MDQIKENQSQGKNQPDAGPDVLKQESPRMCKICGGPNHQGCGCEAKVAYATAQAKAAQGIVDYDQPEPQPASETQELEDQVLVYTKVIAKDIKTMADGFEGLCACMYDTNNYLKLIAGDMITIRKFLTKEDDKLIEPGNSLGNILSYLSNIDQSLKEIKAGRNQDDPGKNKD